MNLPPAYLTVGAIVSVGLLVIAAVAAREALTGELTRWKIERNRRRRGGYIT